MRKIGFLLAKYPFLVIVLLSLPAIAALRVPGFYGASDDLHIAWLQQMDRILKLGQFPPRFVPDLSYGFGYPLFNFVFPLPFYIAEVFHLLGLNFVDSIKLLFGLTVPLSGYFMYRLLKDYTKQILALAGAVVYMYTPYRSTDIYVRGAIGEIVTFVFLPIAVLSVIKVSKGDGKRRVWVGIMALSFSALITSHNIMSYMFFPFLLLLGLFFVYRLKGLPRSSAAVRLFFGFLLGLFISIYFWLPALVESRLMREDTVFNFKNHFPTIRQLITPHFGYGASVAGPYDGMSFFVGVINLLLVVAGIYGVLVWRKRFTNEQLVLSVWALVVFFIAIFMMNFRSSFVWDNTPYLGYFQFPWRFLSLTTLVTPMLVIPLSRLKYYKALGFAIIVLAVLLNFSYFRPQDFLGRTDDYFINRYIPEPHASDAYRETGEEYLRLSKMTFRRPLNIYPRVSVHRGVIKEIILFNGLDAEFIVQSDTLALVSYNKYLFPGWFAKVDGEPAILRPGRPFGQIYITLPPGEHTVEVFFRETNERMVLNIISLLSLLVTVTIIFKYRRHGKKI